MGFSGIFENFQVPLNDGNFGAFGGPLARATWASRPLHESPWVLEYPYCHHIITHIYPKDNKRALEIFKCH